MTKFLSDLLILPFWQGKKAEMACPAKEFGALIKAPLDSGDFLGKEGETLLLYPGKGKEERVVLLGLGKKDDSTPEKLRRAYSAAVKLGLKKKCTTLSVFSPDGDIKPIAEGVYLSNYAFNELRTEKAPVFTKISFMGLSKEDLAVCKKIENIAFCVNFARDLVNGNADDITPQALSHVAKELAKEYPKINTTVFDKKRISQEKMGLLLAVNQGSHREPAFIILEYAGNPGSKEKTAIVGKGITFDTGGLNLKPTGGMETMKCDMSGAAAVLGTVHAAAKIGLKVNIVGVIASTENAIGPNSYKPGDVFKSYEGTTIEITNTDAEGRLVLADALSYVQKNYSPKRMIDLATLTGSIVVALGEEITGLFSNNDKLAKELIRAGETSGEKVWRMPLEQDYKEKLKSPIADMQNAPGRSAGAITAALFLEHFVKDVAWAHLDIAGTAHTTDAKHYNTTKATGIGVRLLIEFLSQ